MSIDFAVEDNQEQSSQDIESNTSHGQGPPRKIVEPSLSPGDNGYDSGTGELVANPFLAMLLFIGTEIMFFSGLIGAFIVFRYGALDWPPPNQPRLPVVVTGINTAILLYSGYMMMRTWKIMRNWNSKKVIQGLTITAVLGLIFLGIQGYEWIQLIKHGLTLTSSIYGSIFYTLIGCHALHVVGAVIWLNIVLMRVKLNHEVYGPRQHVGIKLAGMYWFLVVGLWPVLYGIVYLS
jgi:heme/copper-type cytochrome/quinol oxidase subunit 3